MGALNVMITSRPAGVPFWRTQVFEGGGIPMIEWEN